jgi:hypothetical protein
MSAQVHGGNIRRKNKSARKARANLRPLRWPTAAGMRRQHPTLTSLPRLLSSLGEVNSVRFNGASDATFD